MSKIPTSVESSNDTKSDLITMGEGSSTKYRELLVDVTCFGEVSKQQKQ